MLAEPWGSAEPRLKITGVAYGVSWRGDNYYDNTWNVGVVVGRRSKSGRDLRQALYC